ncbi:hypothetical protein ACFP1L_13875 [Lactiplantibacillus nangangensis]|uniref:Uncharacterized protein n=1 Tax=Lactiplantibacillus nangangensis TaxID=2559917 RepID=A0ABW1SNR9_9LACO|nr:hypothetical protein [Lactiplantibacillus nangangensis]
MDINIFDRNEMTLNVLNLLAEKADLECIDLVLLNFNFSSKQAHELMDFVAEKQVKKQGLTKQECTNQVLKIKPDIENAEAFVDQLKSAALAEGRFPDVLNR